MKTQPMPVKVDEKIEAVLDVFHRHGYATTGYIHEETGITRPTLAKRLDRLYAAGCIEYVHEPTAFWKLVKDPRETTNDGGD